ncbi:MAG: hypothetical protein HON70_20475, partial [Lentisphaerae bacterium]|nr:hypothetical protein [Lentisphaerota bacterium]
NTVKVVRYNDEARALDYLFDLDEMVDDPRDSGRATQCKIHYSFAPSPHDGIMYMASHLSGPPIDQPSYSPWNSWHDPERCFRGAALVAFDTRGDEVLWWDTMYPKEGCRCLLHDEERGLLYSLSYPRDHLFVYDLASRSARDLGRIGSVNGQVLFLDGRHRVWTSTDDGRLARYDPDADRMEISPYILPHNPIYQTGWHSVLYDAVAAPDQPCIYAVTWIAAPRLLRIWPGEGNWGRVEDLGAVTQERDMSVPVSTFLDHSGGLVFGADGMLYYSASRWRDPVYMPEITDGEHLSEGVVWRLDPETLARDEVLVLDRPGYAAQYVSRGAIDRHGDLFFGHVGAKPVGLFRVAVPEDRKRQIAHVPMRMWG